jgi:hypothetical protein
MSMAFPPMTDDEIYELVTSCLIGRLPVATEKRLINTAGELMRVRKLLSDPRLGYQLDKLLDPVDRGRTDEVLAALRKHMETNL